MKKSFAALGAMTLVAIATPALAHTGHNASFAFLDGLTHPVRGLDHVLAMLAVGLWASQLGGRALLALPVAFVVTMTAGAAAAALGFAAGLIEAGILASVIGLGAAVALGVRLPLALATGVTALFAFVHGQAHGLEIADGTWVAPYVAGFVITTALLHATGVAIGLTSRQAAVVGRALGVVIAGTGIALAAL